MSLKTILASFFFKFFNVWFGDRVDGVFKPDLGFVITIRVVTVRSWFKIKELLKIEM